MKCPYCGVEIAPEEEEIDKGTLYMLDDGFVRSYIILKSRCPIYGCNGLIIHLIYGDDTFLGDDGKIGGFIDEPKIQLIYPRNLNIKRPDGVPSDIFQDYEEARLVLQDSPKASAALSRRCLQNLLVQKAGVKGINLYEDIQQVIDSGALPSDLVEEIDAVRQIGNFAAHPIKSTSSGEIIGVEPQEVEWTLEVLEGLFDFYYVKREKVDKRKAALNKKLQDAGKDPMK